MFEEFQICPYTGLRSFTEEESLYFKGREEHIDQATEQLQRNKFLMLTGASGDGKSSLVYAGIVPNARAGFLKAKHTSWLVADFRPERSPFKNLCKSLARQLNIDDPAIVESELKHGFSALVDLYKSSDSYLDANSSTWQEADSGQQAIIKRQAANLMIIVDQFEEFFTNPENYRQGVPSEDSKLVLNLLLESAHIALEEDLPIYVVFTMRSDYIGQCAAFSSLPEYLGFSQFFVPRLNRVQLQQVIEEPASLSGNRIAHRLTERLIHDIAEGVDQLPILQHALNQIWHAANGGKEEMDLLHYAMVSGMPAGELPEDQIGRFTQWFEQLPEEIKKCYHRPNLQNVLDTHANKLYESAEEYYLKKTGKYISDADSKNIIRTAFSCLTKIDQSRAVRNRMTLQEIHLILNNKNIDLQTVGQVLNIFREPGNTFIRPFINEDPASEQLSPEDILDITHESLIRNWDLLKLWAEEEYNSYLVSQDFEQQLGRWVESDKSDSFLLSIGPLTYFENWFKKVNPNSWWVARYLPESSGNKRFQSEKLIADSNEFLNRSAKKFLITRTVMMLGPKRIAATLLGLALILLVSFAVVNYFKRQNGAVLRSVKKETISLANKQKLSTEISAPLIIQQVELGSLTIPEILGSIKDSLHKVEVAIGMAALLTSQGWYQPRNELIQTLTSVDSLLQRIPITDDPELSTTLLLHHNKFRVVLDFALIFNTDPGIKLLAKKNAQRGGQWCQQILKTQSESFTDIQNLSLALENAINYQAFSDEEINHLLKTLSPFESESRSPWVLKNYSRDNLMPRGGLDYSFQFNGLYQDLGYLYASQGETKKVLSCVDSLLLYNQNYYQNDYEAMMDNATNIAGVFYTYGKLEAFDQFIDGYVSRKNISTVEFYFRTLSRILTDNGTPDNLNFYNQTGTSYSNLNLRIASDEMVSGIYQRFLANILLIKNPEEQNLLFARVYKNQACQLAGRYELRGDSTLNSGIDSLFDLSFVHYKKVSPDYFSKITSAVNFSTADAMNVTNKYLYVFPDYFVTFHPFEPRKWLFHYNTSAFVKYILKHGLIKEIYDTKEELKVFENWLMHYHGISTSNAYFMRPAIPHATMTELANQITNIGLHKELDLNLLFLYLGNNEFKLGNMEKADGYYKNLQAEKIFNSLKFKGFNFINDYSFQQYGTAIANLFHLGNNKKAGELMNAFKVEVNRSSLYGYAAQELLKRGINIPLAQSLIDSAKTEMRRIDNPAVFQPNRHQIAVALMLLDAKKHEAEAYQVIKNSISKIQTLIWFGRVHAQNRHLFHAYDAIPPMISDYDRGGSIYQFLLGYYQSFEPNPAWSRFDQNLAFFDRFYLPYINESN